MSRLIKYFTDNTYRYNPANAAKESAIVFGLGKFQPWMLFPASILIQLCAGSFYAWSVLYSAIQALGYDGFTKEALPKVFYTCVAFFGISACLSGPWLERNGPLKPAILGSLLFFLGNLLAGLGLHLKQYWLLLIGFGFFSGMGIGMAYLVPVAVLQKWFPKIRGVASGIAVGAFGLGATIASFVYKGVTNDLSPNQPLNWFLVPGIAYVLIQTPASLLLRFPPPPSPPAASENAKKPAETAASQTTVVDNEQVESVKAVAGAPVVDMSERADAFVKSVFSIDFLFVFLIFFFSVIPGLFYVSRITDILINTFNVADKNVQSTTMAVAGIFNVLGRALFGIASDKLGRVIPLATAGIVQIGMLAGLTVILKSGNVAHLELFRGCVWVLVMCYGASVGLVPGLLSDCFGLGIVGTLYGITLIAWSAAGLCSGLGVNKLLAAYSGDFTPSNITLIVSGGISLCLIIAFALRLHLRQRRNRNAAAAGAAGNNA